MHAGLTLIHLYNMLHIIDTVVLDWPSAFDIVNHNAVIDVSITAL
jgi:hypothetical protein